MSQEAARAFVEAAHFDGDIRMAVQEYLLSHDANPLVNFARERGYDFSPDEISQTVAAHGDAFASPILDNTNVKPIHYWLHPANHDFFAGQRGRPILLHRGWLMWQRMALVVFVASITLGLGVAYGKSYRRYVELRDHGVVTLGQVTNQRIQNDISAEAMTATTFYITYVFTVDDRNYSHEQAVSSSRYHALAAGQPVEILYSPSDPALTVMDGTNSTQEWYLLGSIAFGIGFIIVAGPTLLQFRRESVYGKRGKYVQGEIRVAQASSGGKDGSRVTGTRLEVAFDLPQSERRIHQSINCGFTGLSKNLPPERGRVTIWYVDADLWWVL